MTILICDLDLTFFAEESMIQDGIHEAHKLSYPITITNNGCPKSVRLINPEQLSKLINTAYTEYDGIMILTSGSWDASLREILAEHLDLSPQVVKKFKNCPFLSATTCVENFPNLNIYEIVNMMKNIRLAKYIELHPELKSHRFVMLDDNPDQIESFTFSNYVSAVYATTDSADKSFYQEALNALAYAKLKSQQEKAPEAVSTIKSSPRLFAKRNAEKAGIVMDDETDTHKNKKPRLDLRSHETLDGL